MRKLDIVLFALKIQRMQSECVPGIYSGAYFDCYEENTDFYDELPTTTSSKTISTTATTIPKFQPKTSKVKIFSELDLNNFI